MPNLDKYDKYFDEWSRLNQEFTALFNSFTVVYDMWIKAKFGTHEYEVLKEELDSILEQERSTAAAMRRVLHAQIEEYDKQFSPNHSAA